MLRIIGGATGTIAGTLLPAYFLDSSHYGAPMLVELGVPAFAGAFVGAMWSLVAGIVGGVVGGLVGVVFVLFPSSWLFVGAPFGAYLAKIVVAGILSYVLALFAST